MADECECSLHVRLVGDGCAACNPALALEHANARIADLESENERHEAALQRIMQWAEAYPLDVFPEPDLKRVGEVLQAAGLSLGQVSASNMRHVLSGLGDIARKGLGL